MVPQWACLVVFSLLATHCWPVLWDTWKNSGCPLHHSDTSDSRPHRTHGITSGLKHKNTVSCHWQTHLSHPSLNLNGAKSHCFTQTILIELNTGSKLFSVRLSTLLSWVWSLMCHHCTAHPQQTQAALRVFPPSVGDCAHVQLCLSVTNFTQLKNVTGSKMQ